jgi:hypothetical protein
LPGDNGSIAKRDIEYDFAAAMSANSRAGNFETDRTEAWLRRQGRKLKSNYMNVLVIILVVIASFIALVLLIALFTKKEYSILKEITINRQKPDVFNYIKYIKNQDYYSVWIMIDPNMKREYKGIDGTAGFVSAWDSTNKRAGKGEQSIVKVSEGERLDMQIHFIKPFEGLANAYMTTENANGNQTKVKWGFDSKMAYPMNIMLLFMNMDKMVGKDLEAGLNNLKTILEK